VCRIIAINNIIQGSAGSKTTASSNLVINTSSFEAANSLITQTVGAGCGLATAAGCRLQHHTFLHHIDPAPKTLTSSKSISNQLQAGKFK